MILIRVEEALTRALSALVRPLPSYINRVYELADREGNGFVVKFYRPGRWSEAALADEHRFMHDCAAVDIPLALPLTLADGSTLGECNGISFAVFEKKSGRQFDIESDSSWQRVGSLLGRLHNAGSAGSAPARLICHPQHSTATMLQEIAESMESHQWRSGYTDAAQRIIDTITPLFDTHERVRIHGDFHAGNILERPGEGLMVIDFDDMANGPEAQDFWLVLPDHYPACAAQLEQLLVGYRQFREPDPRCGLLIEPLRTMRMIYFTAWCAMQKEDYRFRQLYPDWGSDSFWAREVSDLRGQFARITETLR